MLLYYFVPTTNYPFRSIYYIVPTTYHIVPSIYYFVTITYYLVPSIYYFGVRRPFVRSSIVNFSFKDLLLWNDGTNSIVSNVQLSSPLAPILDRTRTRRTLFLKVIIQGPLWPSLFPIDRVVSKEKIFECISHRVSVCPSFQC
jgi:hypothetical protein